MKKCFLFLMFVVLAAPASAEYASGLVIERIRLSGDVAVFGVSPQPDETCDHYGDYLRFDHTTEKGKSFLSVLLTAKARGAKIDVWYTKTSKAGEDCYMSNVSPLYGIAIRP